MNLRNLAGATLIGTTLTLLPASALLALAGTDTPQPTPTSTDWQQRLRTNGVMGMGVMTTAGGEESLFQIVAGPTSDTGHNRNGTFIWAERGNGDAYTGGIQDYTIQNGVATITGSGPYIEPDGSKHPVSFTLIVSTASSGATLETRFSGYDGADNYAGTVTAGFVDVGVGAVDPAIIQRQMDSTKTLFAELRQRMDALKLGTR